MPESPGGGKRPANVVSNAVKIELKLPSGQCRHLRKRTAFHLGKSRGFLLSA
jgi:hypothetical protein